MDSTNENTAQAGVTSGGTMARRFAVKRLEQIQRAQGVQRPGRIQPPQVIPVGKKRRS